jgi:hypothetical protein
MSSKGIDYSKWDRMEFSDDDADEDDGPRVTRLEQPSHVTLSQTGEVSIRSQQSPGDTAETIVSPSLSFPSTKKEASGIPSSWTEKGASTALTDSGGAQSVFWTQDRQIVTLRFRVPSDRTSKDWKVSAKGMLKYADRNVGVSSEKPILKIAQGDFVLVEKALPRHIHGPQDADKKEESAVDWTIERSLEVAYVTVTLLKAAPMDGVVVWWNRPLEGAAEISMDWRESSASATGFQQAWDEAHDRFRQKMAETS